MTTLRVVLTILLVGVPSLGQKHVSQRKGQLPRTSEESIPSSAELYKQALPSVMALSVDGKDGSTAIGTAFLIASNGVAVTAFHVVNGARRVRARFHTGESAEVIGLIDADERRDLALIQV